MPKRAINKFNKGVENTKKAQYRTNLEFRKLTKERIDWDIEDDLDGLIYNNHGRHLKIAAQFPGVLLEWDISGQVDAIEVESIDNNAIYSTTAAKSGIVRTPGVYDENGTPTHILTPINNPASDINVDQ